MHRLAAGELPGKVMVRPVTRSVSERRAPHRGSTTSRSPWTRRCSTTPAAAELLDFYGDVFGWTEGDNTGEPGNPLILYTGRVRPVRVPAARRPARCSAPAIDHFGLQVATLDELEAIVERARRHARAATTACTHHRRARAHDRTARPTTTRSRARTSASCCR